MAVNDNELPKRQDVSEKTIIPESVSLENIQTSVIEVSREPIEREYAFAQVVSFSSSSSDGLFDDDSFASINVDYTTMKNEFMHIIDQCYQEEFVSWKDELIKKSGIKSNHPYQNVTLGEYAQFLRYANRDKNDDENRNLSLDVGQRSWFLGHQYFGGSVESYIQGVEQRSKLKQDFITRLPYLPIAIPFSAKKKIEIYLVKNVEETNWKTFWDRFIKDAVILPASGRYISDLINGVQATPIKHSSFSVTKCNAPAGLQKKVIAQPKGF